MPGTSRKGNEPGAVGLEGDNRDSRNRLHGMELSGVEEAGRKTCLGE